MEVKSDIRLVDLVGCPECGRSYVQKNIYRHLTTQHNWTKEECKNLIVLIKHEKRLLSAGAEFPCDICEAVFKNFQLMARHRKFCLNQSKRSSACVEEEEVVRQCFVEEMDHVDLPETSASIEFKDISPLEFPIKISDSPSANLISNFKEDSVEKSSNDFSAESSSSAPDHDLSLSSINVSDNGVSLSPSKLEVGGNNTKLLNRYRISHLICPECNEKCESCDDLVYHCRDYHQTEDRKFVMEQQFFDSFNDFKKWFDQRQEDTCTSLTKRTGHGGETFYRCHRVGKYSSVAKKRKSNPRKLDQCCTAFLKVFTHPDGHTLACGCFTHIGHDLDHKLLWLTETQENYVRELIDLGWHADQIYFYIREEYDDYECKLKYISKNDIRNITVRHKKAKSMQREMQNTSDTKNEGASTSSEPGLFRKRHRDCEPTSQTMTLSEMKIDFLLNKKKRREEEEEEKEKDLPIDSENSDEYSKQGSSEEMEEKE